MTFRSVRQFVYPLLPFLIAAVVLIVVPAMVTGLAGGFRGLADFVNGPVLFGIARYHQSEVPLLLVPIILVLVFGPFVLRRTPSIAQRVAGVFGGFVLLAVALYIIHPFGLWRISPWPWAGGVLLAACLFVWLRLSWAYLTPLSFLYARFLRSYFGSCPRGADYFSLLSRIYYGGEDPLAGCRDEPLVPLPPSAWGRLFRLAARVFGGTGARSSPLFPLLRFLAQRRLEWPPERSDRILVREIEHLRDVARHELELTLYGRDTVPEMDPRVCAAARSAQDRWLALTDALAECFVLGLPQTHEGGARRSDRLSRACHLRAADCYARATGGIGRQSLRVWTESEKETANRMLTWWPEGQGEAWRARAQNFLEKEIACLEMHLGIAPVPPQTRSAIQLRELLDWAGNDIRRGRRAARFCLAQLSYNNVSGRKRTSEDKGPLAELSNRIKGVVLRSPGVAYRSLRERFFEWALLQGAEGHVYITDVIDDVYLNDPWHPEDCTTREARREERGEEDPVENWKEEEHRVLGEARRLRAGALMGEQRFQNFDLAISAYGKSCHCSARAIADVVPVEHRPTAQKMAAALPGPRPVAPRPGYEFHEFHGAPDRPLAISRAPNWFTRAALRVAALPLVVLAMLIATAASARGVIEIPDFRVGGDRLDARVRAISPGREPEASIWAATEGAGVHVKGGGTNHFWQSIRAAESGLLSDDVLRVDVGSDRVAYLCASKDRRGLCVSTLPEAPPGTQPGLGIRDWWTLIGFSSFPGVDDRIVSVIGQTDDPRVILFGTRRNGDLPGIGIGRYSSADRRWLDDISIDEQHGFLPFDHGSVNDLVAIRVGEEWHAYAGTDNGLAGGPVLGANVTPGAWRSVPGTGLISGRIDQVRARLDEGIPVVGYRTRGDGLGCWSRGKDDTGVHRVIVGEDRVPGLTEAGLLDVAYRADDSRIWMADRGGPAGGVRISAYREATHEWRSQSSADRIPDGGLLVLEADSGRAGQAVAGLVGGILVATDAGEEQLASRPSPVEGQDVFAVAAAPDGFGLAAGLRRQADGARWIAHAPRSALDAYEAGEVLPWRTMVGPGRVPGLELDDVSMVEPLGSRLLLGTRRHGVCVIDTVAREVRALRSAPDPVVTRDLCAVTPREGDDLLFQITEGLRLRAISPFGDDDWRTILGGSAGDVDPRELRTVAAAGSRIFLGSGQAVSIYDMATHGWEEAPPVPNLRDLLFADGALWSHSGSDTGILSVLAADRTAWEQQFTAVRAFHGTKDVLAVIDGPGRLSIRKGGSTTAAVEPRPIEPGTDNPRLAAVDGAALYLAPVSGGIGRYDLDRHRWDKIAYPVGLSGSAKELRVNQAGVWLLGPGGKLYLNPFDEDGETLMEFSEDPVVEDVRGAFWSAQALVAFDGKGRVVRVARGGSEELVGPGFEADLEKGISAAVEFADDLFVVVGDKLGRYSRTGHAWSSVSPTNGSAITEIAVTERFLYVLGGDGGLFRIQSGAKADWESVNPVLGANPVRDMASFGTSLGMVVAGTGEYSGAAVLRDVDPHAPVWLLACSAGPPGDAEITCAAELGTELYVGTRASGLWAWLVDSGEAGRVTPPRWRRIPLLAGGAESAAIKRIVSAPENPRQLAVLTDQAVVLLEREIGGPWGVSRTAGEGAPFAMAVARDGVFVANDLDGATTLRFEQPGLPPVELIGSGNPQRQKATASIAVDPATGDVLRSDAAGSVSRYRWLAHSWAEESVGASVTDLFTMGNSVWAWSPETRSLLENGAAGWTPLRAGTIAHAVWNERGILFETTTGEIFVKEGSARERLVLPREARAGAARLSEVTALAEAGDWLLLGTKGGIRAYDHLRHRWESVSDTPVEGFCGGNAKGSLYATAAGGGLWWVDVSGGEKIRVERVEIGADSSVGRVIRAGSRVLALTGQGALVDLERGFAAGPALVSPRPLPASAEPEVLAATEWEGRLFLSLDGADGPHVASYDPEQMAWSSLRIKEGRVSRFHKLTDSAGREQLFAETGQTSAADAPPGMSLLRFEFGLHGREWSYVLEAGGLRDLASDDRSTIWVVDENYRVLAYQPGAARLIPLFAEPDVLTGRIRGAIEIGSEIILLTDQGEIYHYSLDDLRFRNAVPGSQFSTMFDVRGTPFAVEVNTGDIFGYVERGGGRKWERMPVVGWNAAHRLDPTAPGMPGRWKIGSEGTDPVFSFRATPEDPFREIRLVGGRFDFNRVNRIGFRSGTLWCETMAGVGSGPVYRKFAIGAQIVEEKDGAWRFRIPQAEARAALAEGASIDFDGARFRLAASEGGRWRGRDPGTGAAVTFGVALKPAGRGGSVPIDVKPVFEKGSGLRLDVDIWEDLAASGDFLIVSTPGGLLTIEMPTAGEAGVRRLFRENAGGEFTGFTSSEGELLAGYREGAQRVLQFMPAGLSWREVTGQGGRERYESRRGIFKYNELLAEWRLANALGEVRLEVRTRDQSENFRPVSLGENGFGFDRPVALEIGSDSIVLYTSDGRVSLDRRGSLVDLEPELAVEFAGPARAVRRPVDGRLVLIGGGRPGSTAVEHVGGKWRSLPSEEIARLESELRETLHEGDWTWHSDDRVEVKVAPFEGEPLRGSYRPETGQFTFDTVRAIQTAPDGLWVATDSGVLTLRRQGRSLVVENIGLNRVPPFPSQVEAAFIQAFDGRWFLGLGGGQRGRSALFSYSTGGWQLPDDLAEAAEAVQEASRWLLHGTHWRLLTEQANPLGLQAWRGFEMAGGSGGTGFVEVRLLRDGTFDFENVTAICGPASAPVLGSLAGLMRVHAATGENTFVRTAGAVSRVAEDESGCHVRIGETGQETIRSGPDLGVSSSPEHSFEEKDRTLLDGANWKIRKASEGNGQDRTDPRSPAEESGRFFLRPAPGLDPVPVRFLGNRFDFDTVLAVASLGEDALLATSWGFLRHTSDPMESFTPEKGLPAASLREPPRIFSLWRGEKRVTCIEHPRGVVSLWESGWSAVAAEEVSGLLDDRDREVARNGTWSVRRDGGAVRIDLCLPGNDAARVEFSPSEGSFGFDLLADVQVVGDKLLAATAGGLVTYDGNGRMRSLRSDPSGSGAPESVTRLVAGVAGPLAEISVRGRRAYAALREDEWVSVDSQEANEIIRESLARVHTSEREWTVRRAPQGGFGFRWEGVGATLMADRGARFAHDRILSADWHDDSLWLATRGGVVRFRIADAAGNLWPLPAGHLMTAGLPGAEAGQFDAWSLRSDGDAGLVARVAPGGQGIDRLVLSTGGEGFEPGPAEGDPSTVLVDRPGLWRWELPGRSRVTVDLDANTFALPSDGRQPDLFRNGTLGFYDLTSSGQQESRPILYRSGWFIATSAGVLRLSPDLDAIDRAYLADLDGRAIEGVHHLFEENGGFFARAATGLYRYAPDADGWRMVSGDETRERAGRRPVVCRSVTFTFPEPDRVVARMRADRLDSDEAPEILGSDRFLFDEILDFAWSESGCFAVTPVGLAHIEGADGTVRLHRAGLPGEFRGLRLSRDREEGVVCLSEQGQAWRAPTDLPVWTPVKDPPAVIDRFTVLAEDEMFLCRRTFGGEIDVEIDKAIGNLPVFRLGETNPPLFQNGLFGFDDLRDARLMGRSDLLLSTRLGVWHYRLTEGRPLHLPVGAIYYADREGERVEMVELGQFLRGPSNVEDAFVYGSSGDFGFEMIDDAHWRVAVRSPIRENTRVETVPDGSIWTFSLEKEVLTVEKAFGNRKRSYSWSGECSPDDAAGEIGPQQLQSMFATDTSFWIPIERGILWVRRSEFD